MKKIAGDFAILCSVMTTKEVSDTYGVDSSVVRKACISGRIESRKSGGTWIMLRKDADDLWNGTTTPSASKPY